MNVRAAKTALYRGTWYRSRLEATWAAFFYQHSIAVEYEQRWFEFRDGTKYQPDFWLPESQAWFEVKGELLEADKIKVLSLARAAALRGELVLMGGAPAGYVFGEVTQWGKWNLNCSFGRCASCDGWTVAMAGCRACGFLEPDPSKSTYIDFHDSFDKGCESRCDGAFVWVGNAPVCSPIDDSMEHWAAQSMSALSGFEIVPKGKSKEEIPY